MAQNNFIMPSYLSLPARIINVSTRRHLSLYLNPKSPLLIGDWQNFAENLGFDITVIRYLNEYKDPTNELLDIWIDRRGDKATIGELINILVDIGRQDVLQEITVYLEKDVANYHRKLEEERHLLEKIYPVQDPEISTACDSDEETLTLDDGRIYDAFVCFAESDLLFVKEMIHILESKKYGLKLCINVRDLLPGKSRDKTITKIIEEKCRRFIVILTPEFLVSRECNFQAEFAFALSIDKSKDKSKIIPIILRPCQVPRILRFITACDYTKADVREWFWDRLVAALKAPFLPKHPNLSGQMSPPAQNLHIVSSDCVSPALTSQNVQTVLSESVHAAVECSKTYNTFDSSGNESDTNSHVSRTSSVPYSLSSQQEDQTSLSSATDSSTGISVCSTSSSGPETSERPIIESLKVTKSSKFVGIFKKKE